MMLRFLRSSDHRVAPPPSAQVSSHESPSISASLIQPISAFGPLSPHNIPRTECGISKKYNKLVNITKKQTHRYRELTSGYQWGKGSGGKTWVGVKSYKLLGIKLITRIHHTTWGVEPIFHSNCKWSITFNIVNYYTAHL